jgi:hypothetical protein
MDVLSANFQCEAISIYTLLTSHMAGMFVGECAEPNNKAIIDSMNLQSLPILCQ